MRLRKGHRIVVVLLSKVWRARVTLTAHQQVFFFIPELGVSGAGTPQFDGSASPSHGCAPRREEGETWARGWDTDEAKALVVAWSLA